MRGVNAKDRAKDKENRLENNFFLPNPLTLE
nr:MAG TPA: Herpesvirus UL51 protein [Caudoviricetes sp.]